MMCYKDMTFCGDWCKNTECFRNYQHILDAQKEGGDLQYKEWMPISFFVEPPKDCNERISP